MQSAASQLALVVASFNRSRSEKAIIRLLCLNDFPNLLSCFLLVLHLMDASNTENLQTVGHSTRHLTSTSSTLISATVEIHLRISSLYA